jgi:phytoene dehydrogenase-like protein
MESTPSRPDSSQVVIVGGGLAGLACAKVLELNGTTSTIIEATNHVGGKVATTVSDGVTIDRGFQVYLPDYPEGRRFFDYRSLELQPLFRGVTVDLPSGARGTLAFGEDRIEFAKTLRHITSLSDLSHAARVLLRTRALPRRADDVFALLPQSSTLRTNVLVPFLRGVYLNEEGQISVDELRFLWDRFRHAGAALPAAGMHALPLQLASSLQSQVLLNAKVSKVASRSVTLEDGHQIRAEVIVLATSADVALSLAPGVLNPVTYSSVGALTLLAPEPLKLNGSVYVPSLRPGPVLTVTDLSEVAPTYNQRGGHLISVSFRPGANASTGAVLQQLRATFGSIVDTWEVIDLTVIDQALPITPPSSVLRTPEQIIGQGLVIAGDYLESPSINGALRSGRKAARIVMKHLSGVGSGLEPRVK